MTYILITCVLMVTLSSLPDLDMEFRVYGIKHRGITHTLLGAIFFGVAFAILIGYAYGSIGWLMGFIAGFGGTVSHLLGDVFTYTSFKPLYPFSKKEVALGYFKASNKTINNAMLTLGIMTFIISLVIA